MPGRLPNILLFFTDQQRADTVAALGNPIIRTPALDRLCREGTAFTRCYTPSPVCVSARCAMLTGLPPHRTGCVDNNTPVAPDVKSFVERLAELGYQTHGIGKMHFTPDSRRPWGFQRRDYSEEMAGSDDFRAFLDRNGYSHVTSPQGVRSEMYYIPQPSQLPAHLHNTAWTADRSIDFLRERDRSRPFFLMSSFIKPHPPFESPTPWNKLYRTAEMSPPFRPDGFEALLNYWNHVQNRYKYRDHGYDELLVRTIRAAYYACISFIDYHVGRVLEALGEEIDRTMIVFTSDHGELLGDYGSFGKRCMLDAAAAIPMIVRWPAGTTAPRLCGRPATLLDLWPTFLAAAGHDEVPSGGEGVNLLDLATGAAGRDVVFSQFQRRGYALHMATSAAGKYVYCAADGREQYLDLAAEARETVNRIDDPQCRPAAQELRGRLIRRFQRDGYVEPLDGDSWRAWPKRSIPDDPDAGLLFQDEPDLQKRIDALGPYARPIQTIARGSDRLLRTDD